MKNQEVKILFSFLAWFFLNIFGIFCPFSFEETPLLSFFPSFFGIFRRILDGRIYLCWVIWWKIVILFDYGWRINRDFGGKKKFFRQGTFKSDWKSMEGNLCGQVKVNNRVYGKVNILYFWEEYIYFLIKLQRLIEWHFLTIRTYSSQLNRNTKKNKTKGPLQVNLNSFQNRMVHATFWVAH